MHSIIMDPTVGTFAGFIVEPTDVLTTDIRIPMEDIMGDTIDLTPMEDIILTPMEAMEAMEDIIVRTNFGPHRRHMLRV
jgi:hypothetical protein